MPTLNAPLVIHDLETYYLPTLDEALEDTLRVGHWSTPKWSKRIQIIVRGYAVGTQDSREYDFTSSGRVVRDITPRSHELRVYAVEGDVHTMVAVEPATVDHTWETVIFSVVDGYE